MSRGVVVGPTDNCSVTTARLSLLRFGIARVDGGEIGHEEAIEPPL